MADLESIIETAWEGRDKISPKTKGPVRKSVDEVLLLLDQGKARVAEKKDGKSGSDTPAKSEAAPSPAAPAASSSSSTEK